MRREEDALRSPPSGWRGHLSATFARRGARSTLIARKHQGPLLLQRVLYPAGNEICHGIVLHPPGGVVGGDSLCIEISALSGHVLLTTPGAGKWYRSAGPEALEEIHFDLGPGAVLEWLPQENIVFNGAKVRMQTRVYLAEGAAYIGWEVTCFGRAASGERFEQGLLRQSSEIWSGEAQLWGECTRVPGGGSILRSMAALDGASVVGVLLAAGREIPGSLVQTCRDVPPGAGRAGVTALPRVLVARILGNSAQQARSFLCRIWAAVRLAWTGRAACPPRIWNA